MKNNKRKVLPLLLAGVLLLSAGAYGTRAYFTDSAEQNVGIKLTLGNLEIKSESSTIWKYTPDMGTDKIMNSYDINDQLIVKDDANTAIIIPTDVQDSYDLKTKITVTNVRPGDAFTRVFTFKNDGTLTQRISMRTSGLNDVGNVTDRAFTVSITNLSNNLTDLILKPNTSEVYTIKVSVLGTVENEFNNIDKIALEYLEKNLVIDAVQPNAN